MTGAVGSPGTVDDGPGQIVFLNGTSSAGTTSLARAVQDAMATPYLHTGIDHFLKGLPPRLLVSFDPAADEAPPMTEGWLLPFHDGALVGAPRLGPAALRVLAGMYRAVAALAGAGVDVVVDDVIYDVRVLQTAVHALADLPVLFVAVRCPLAVAEQRERDRGDRAPGGARVFHTLVHSLVATHGRYDLEVDTGVCSPQAGARRIKETLATGPPGNAFRALRQRL
jgi:chloramphenicol 3-O phosphotransferase